MIKNIFRLKTELVVTLGDSTEYKSNSCTDELYEKVLTVQKSKKGNEVMKTMLDKIFYPKQAAEMENYERIKKSSILTIVGNSACIPSISQLSVPQLLADKIAEAEANSDEDAITAYKNFWTLLSLNPNEKVRDNLFWFLNKWGMSICKSGLFVAYRNVHLKAAGTKYDERITEFVSRNYYEIQAKNCNPTDYILLLSDEGKYYSIHKDEEIPKDCVIIGNIDTLYNNIIFCDTSAGTVYTDDRTHTFEIRLGHIVSMPRKDVCENSEISCAAGLHAGGKAWLNQNYCGQIGIKVLINPADCCAAPKIDSYGKLRACAYYPVQIVKFKDGKIIDEDLPDGFEADFIDKISYTGTINNVDNDNYKLNIPQSEVNIEDTYTRLRGIAEAIKRTV